MELKSDVKSVTVYKDRALVERLAQPKLTEGEHTLVFCGLPMGIDSNSVQISGGKQAILQDLKLKDVYHDKISDEKKSEIVDEMEELEDIIQELNDKVNNLNEEKSFLINFANVSTESAKKSLLALFVPDKMQEMLKFYNGKLNDLDTHLRTNKKELAKLERRMQVLKKELNKFGQKNLKSEKQIEIKVFVKESAEIDFILSYVVMNASWEPIYDLRLDSNEKKLSVAYNAVVKQQTGEKWENVKLNLSTARPQVSGNVPSLSPWYLDIYDYDIPVAKTVMKAKKEMKRSVNAKISPSGIEDDMMFDELEEAPMEFAAAEVETGATAVVFSIPGNCTISNNYDEHKIGITSLEFDSELEYSTVPKINPFAYLTAITKNTSDYPFLQGKTNIFLDNSFVAHSNLKLVAPNEEFRTSLGVDEGIHVEHKLVNKFSKDEGLFSKKSKKVFEYKIEIKNNKKTESHIKVKDQVPVSQNQEIKIELLEPKIKENTELLKKSDDGGVEWNLSLEPGTKTLLNLKFTVEFPKDQQVVGLG